MEQVALHAQIRQRIVALDGGEAAPEKVLHLVVELDLFPVLVYLHQRPLRNVGYTARQFLRGKRAAGL